MTKEEKIEILETEKAYMIAHGGDRQAEALTSAIQALEQEPSETIHGSTYGGVSWGGTYKPQEPCEDAVSRQAVLDLVVANHTELNGLNVVMYSPFYKDIIQLPPVDPQGPNVEELQKRSYLEGFHEALKMIHNEALKKAVYARSESEEEYEAND